MLHEFIGEWVEDRKGRILRILKIDKSKYCTLADPDGKPVAFHEPFHTLKIDFGVHIKGTHAQAQANAK